MIDLFKYKTSQ